MSYEFDFATIIKMINSFVCTKYGCRSLFVSSVFSGNFIILSLWQTKLSLVNYEGTLLGLMVRKLSYQTIVNELDSY